MSNQSTMCPVCGAVCKLNDIRLVNKCINLAYSCIACGLEFTIAASTNAYEIAKRINHLEGESNDRISQQLSGVS